LRVDAVLDRLNSQQREAVTADPQNPLLIVAGAGTGKTRVITHRLAHMVRDHGLPPWRILATTFTNKAAEEMRRRAADLMADFSPADFQIATFHSHCARVLRRDGDSISLNKGFTIADETDQLRAVKMAMERLQISERDIKPAEARHVINQCKMRMLGPSEVTQYRDNSLASDYMAIYETYEKVLKESGAIDFEDLLLHTVRLLKTNQSVREYYQHRFRHVMVDEYQDTNLVQVELVDLLAGTHRGLTVVGDEDQCIYSWRGADISNLIEFQNRFPEARLVRLEQNYRSTGNILRAAGTVIAHNTERLGKTLYTRDDDGPPISILAAQDEHEECRGIINSIEELTHKNHGYGYGDMAVFYRVSALSRNIEDHLQTARIPYRLIGGVRFYDRMEIKDMVAYLQVAANPSNQLALSRIINTPKRGIGAKTVESLLQVARQKAVSSFEILINPAQFLDLGKATLSKVEAFGVQLAGWHEATKLSSPAQVLDQILAETRYPESLGDPMNPETKARLENIGELKSALVEYEGQRPEGSLTDWLELVSLMNPADEVPNDGNTVSLMTIHAAKGLEFPVVFVLGCEQGLFPNARAYSERGDMEEERRLFYVALTRARHHLILTRTRMRLLYGQHRWNDPSAFLDEIPMDVLEGLDPWSPSFFTLEQSARREMDSHEPDDIVIDPEILHAGYNPHPPHLASPDDWLPAEKPSLPIPRLSSSSAIGPTANEPAPPIKRGALVLGGRVQHSLLGKGTVTGISGSHENQRVLVRFDDGTVSQLLARFAGLRALDS
jgi:DNA helicase-2/ATP-dependent DNA helicase PcrA